MTTQHLFTAASRPLIRHARRPRVRQVATIAAVSLWLLVTSVAGATVALRGYSGDLYRLGPAEVTIQTSLATEGTADVYVPIVDWGIRAHPFTAPLRLQAQLVSIDRRAAIGALRAPGGAGAGFEIRVRREHHAGHCADRVDRAIALWISDLEPGAGVDAVSVVRASVSVCD